MPVPKVGTVTPILRMFDIAKAREFYLYFLGFAIRFEHRSDDNAPLYKGIARDDANCICANITATARPALTFARRRSTSRRRRHGGRRRSR